MQSPPCHPGLVPKLRLETRLSAQLRCPAGASAHGQRPAAETEFRPQLRSQTEFWNEDGREWVAKQNEGRSLVALLENSPAAWPMRTLFTHLGRWEKGKPPESGKYAQCSVRTPEYHLVSTAKGDQPKWMLFDVRTDSGEKQDIAAEHAEIVAEMGAAYEKWWASVVPMMVNENVPLAPANPFWTLHEKQFGTAP